MINKHYLITLLELYYYRQSRVWEEIERNDLASMDDRSFSLYLKTLIKDKRKKDTFDILEINKAIEKAKKIVDYCKHNKVPIEIISFESANYPTNKFNTIPKSDNPVILYVVGNSKLLKLDSVAFIGSRNTDSIYYDLGIQYAKKLAKKYIIVSGLARGSDTAGHEGALLSGKTVAVLANGLDKVYPKENKDLANKIYVNGGALISEYPPYSMTKPYFFAQRDRLQAALSKAIVVLETGIKSGTMITIDYAKKIWTSNLCCTTNW